MRVFKWTVWGAVAAAGILFAGCAAESAEALLGVDKADQSALPFLASPGAGGTESAPLIRDIIRPTSGSGSNSNGSTNGNDNGATNGNDNGATNGNDNGATNGNDNGATNGNDNGATNGNDNGATNGNDNGATNGNDNGATNGNDNGATNGNDNGATNGNDNGATNGNDNGGNGNDNGGSGGTCPDGSTQLDTELFGAGQGDAEYRSLPAGCKRFRVDVEDLQGNKTYAVLVNGMSVGTIRTDSRGRGELRYDTEDGNFPVGFPELLPGDVVSVGGVSGVLQTHCSSANCNG